MTVLQVEDLTVRYGGVTAVDGVTFAVPAGSLTGLIGPNGAGKTSLIDALTGMTRSKGTVVYQGRRIEGLPAHRRSRLGLVRTFQSVELFKELTIRENLQTYAKNHDADRAIEEALVAVDLRWAADRYPSELSHGQSRLASVARALAARPDFLLLDEPAAGLDAEESQWLGRRLRQLVDERGLSILLIDHDVDLIMKVSDHVLVLNFGRLIAEGPPEAVRRNPQVAEAYLGASAETTHSAVII